MNKLFKKIIIKLIRINNNYLIINKINKIIIKTIIIIIIIIKTIIIIIIIIIKIKVKVIIKIILININNNLILTCC